MLKKHFYNTIVFIISYIIISLAADYYYYNRVIQKDAGQNGQISYSDFRVFWFAAYDMRHHILKDPTTVPVFRHFWFLKPKLRDLLITGSGPGDEHVVYKKDSEFYHFRYSPFIAFIMIPLGKIAPPGNALLIWYGILNIMFLSAILILTRQMSRGFGLSQSQGRIVLWGIFLMSLRFYMLNLSLGQTDVCIALFLVFFLISYVRKRDILSGVLLAIILQLKPFFGPILFYLLLVGRIKVILSTLIVFAASLFVPAYMLSMEKTIGLIKDWFDILNFSIPSQILNPKNHSLAYLIGSAVLNIHGIKDLFPMALNLFYFLSAIFTLFAYTALRLMKEFEGRSRERLFPYFEVAVFIFVSLLFSPTTWEANFVSLIIPIAVTISLTLSGSKEKLPAIAIGIFFISSCIGSDITKFIPLVNLCSPLSIPLGTISLAFAMIWSYRRYIYAARLKGG